MLKLHRLVWTMPAWVTLLVAVEPSTVTVSTMALGKMRWPGSISSSGNRTRLAHRLSQDKAKPA